MAGYMDAKQVLNDASPVETSKIRFEDRLVYFSFAVLVFAVAYGIIVGACITMYYGLVANMSSYEDTLSLISGVSYLLSILINLPQLALATKDVRQKFYRQAAIRLFVFLAPIFIFLAADGLVAHYIFWASLSDTDRFHLLHHTLSTALPLTFLYGLALRRFWRPQQMQVSSTGLSRRGQIETGIVLLISLTIMFLVLGILIGNPILVVLAPIIVVTYAVLGILR